MQAGKDEPKYLHYTGKEGGFRKVGWIVQAHSWQMVVQGLQVMSDWLNIMMSFCCLVGSYLPEVLIVPCLGEPWSVFHHIHNLSTVPAMEEVSLVTRSIWPLAPLWLDQTLMQGSSSIPLFGSHLKSIAGFLNLGLCSGPRKSFPKDISGSQGSFASFHEFDFHCLSRSGECHSCSWCRLHIYLA